MKYNFKPYEEYKDSPLPWLNLLPRHWEVKRAKALYVKANRPIRETDEVVTCFRDGTVTLRKNRRTTGFTESIKEVGYQGIRKGDLVIHVMDAFAGAIGVSDSDGKSTPVYSVCIPKKDLNNYYYAHIVREMAKSGFIQSLYRGIRERSSDFRFDVFANQLLPVPPRTEQDQIVKYLDFKLAKITKFIDTKKKLILALKEQKQAIINEAVTKGVNSNVKMKFSGVNWIGDIPEHWEVKRCKYLYSEVDERSKCGNETHLSMSQKFGLVSNEELEERRLLSENYVGAKVCKKDDLVLNRLKAHLGVFSLSPQLGVVSPDYTVLRSNKLIFPKFGEYMLKSQLCRGELCKRVKGIVVGFWRLYTDDFYNIRVPLPVYTEQKYIVGILEKNLNDIDVIISKTQQEIRLISEYRTRLISDVITGKFDVRNIMIDEITEEDSEIDLKIEESTNSKEVLHQEECEV